MKVLFLSVMKILSKILGLIVSRVCVLSSVTAACPPPLHQTAPPTTLIIGDSIIRNVRMRGAVTRSFPGATVMDKTEKIPHILKSFLEVTRIIIHTGTNDIPKQQSELLKQDFLHLFSVVNQFHLRVFISGPTPTCDRGVGRFSRLLSLNTWLSSVCGSYNMGFINNFDAFWQWRNLFGADGLHLNSAGCRLLSANLTYGIPQGELPRGDPPALSGRPWPADCADPHPFTS
uniref:SGNH hydrolase-type esterase domain-containing protein n=1 Tax=Acanthochromis polyacanthus TaxID=80966 RepID=A0A3Q1FHY2_9TELE